MIPETRVSIYFISCIFVYITISRYTYGDTRVGAEIQCSQPATGYEIKNLTHGNWTFKTYNSSCLGVSGSNKSECNVTLSFCQKLVSQNACNGTGACMSTFNGTGQNTTKQFSIGEYTQNPFSVNDIFANGFAAKYSSIIYTNPEGKNCTLTTEVHFNCNQQVNWQISSTGSTVIPTQANATAKFDQNTCKYKIQVDYSGACRAIIPSMPLESLSAGTVILLIFFISIALYCIIGCTCNCVRGYEGREIIPNSAFWIDLPVLIADGILFTCSCCRPEPSTYDSI